LSEGRNVFKNRHLDYLFQYSEEVPYKLRKFRDTYVMEKISGCIGNIFATGKSKSAVPTSKQLNEKANSIDCRKALNQLTVSSGEETGSEAEKTKLLPKSLTSVPVHPVPHHIQLPNIARRSHLRSQARSILRVKNSKTLCKRIRRGERRAHLL
jgi:hypothetical protein